MTGRPRPDPPFPFSANTAVDKMLHYRLVGLADELAAASLAERSQKGQSPRAVRLRRAQLHLEETLRALRPLAGMTEDRP